MKYFLPLSLLLLSCTKDYSAENVPASSPQPVAAHQTAPTSIYTKVVLIGLPQPALADSLDKALSGAQIPFTNSTAEDFNLDYETHMPIASPVGKGLVIADVISQDVYFTRTTTADYIARADAFKTAWEAAGWTVWILSPSGIPNVKNTASGFTAAEYAAQLTDIKAASTGLVAPQATSLLGLILK
jgi:hypothetical protein